MMSGLCCLLEAGESGSVDLPTALLSPPWQAEDKLGREVVRPMKVLDRFRKIGQNTRDELLIPKSSPNLSGQFPGVELDWAPLH